MAYSIYWKLDYNLDYDPTALPVFYITDDFIAQKLIATTEFGTITIPMAKVRLFRVVGGMLEISLYNGKYMKVPIGGDDSEIAEIVSCLNWYVDVHSRCKEIFGDDVYPEYAKTKDSVFYECRSLRVKDSIEEVELIVTTDYCEWRVLVDEITSIKVVDNMLTVAVGYGCGFGVPTPKNKEDARFRSCLEKVQKIVESNKGGQA